MTATTSGEASRAEYDDGKFRLSYSGCCTLFECEKKFYLGRIARVAPDPDAPDSHALRFGTAFHYVLEHTMHLKTAESPHLLREAVNMEDLDEEDYYRLAAMLNSYYRMHEASGLRAHACEVPIYLDWYRGYVDVILVDDKTGGWWMGDIKTAGQLTEASFVRLKNDPQLTIYSANKALVAAATGLDVGKFQGIAYRTNLKPRDKPRKDEVVATYCGRVKPVSYSAYIRESMLNQVRMENIFKSMYLRALELKNGRQPLQNFSACVNSYGRVCEFWSQCYGSKFSETRQPILHSSVSLRQAPESLIVDDWW